MIEDILSDFSNLFLFVLFLLCFVIQGILGMLLLFYFGDMRYWRSHERLRKLRNKIFMYGLIPFMFLLVKLDIRFYQYEGFELPYSHYFDKGTSVEQPVGFQYDQGIS